MRKFILVIAVILLVGGMAWAEAVPINTMTSPVPTPAAPPQTDKALEGVVTPSPAPTAPEQQQKAAPPAPTPKVIVQKVVKEVKGRIIEQQIVPNPHPATYLGHHDGSGHSPVYQRVKDWNPASVSFVEAKNAKLRKELTQQRGSVAAPVSAGESAATTPKGENSKEEQEMLLTILITLLAAGAAATIICLIATRRVETAREIIHELAGEEGKGGYNHFRIRAANGSTVRASRGNSSESTIPAYRAATIPLFPVSSPVTINNTNNYGGNEHPFQEGAGR